MGLVNWVIPSWRAWRNRRRGIAVGALGSDDEMCRCEHLLTDGEAEMVKRRMRRENRYDNPEAQSVFDKLARCCPSGAACINRPTGGCEPGDCEEEER